MAADCLGGWKIDNLEKPAEGSAPGIDLSRTVRDRGAETVTHVVAGKLTSNGDDVMAGASPEYALVITVYTTTHQLEAGAR